MIDLNDQSFKGKCPTCGQPYLQAEVERLEAELDKLKRDLDAAQRAALKHYNGWCSAQAANALLDVVRALLADTRMSSGDCVVRLRALAGQTAALEFDDTVSRLKEVARSHGWTLKSWGLGLRLWQGQDEDAP